MKRASCFPALQALAAVACCQFAGSIAAQNYTIPVVVHVLWNSPVENISDAQIMSGLDALNAGFNSLSTGPLDPPYDTLAANMEIGFCLASTGPDGTPTTGIDRIQTPLAEQGGAPGTYLNQWPPDHYLNIWLIGNYAQGGHHTTYSPAEAAGNPSEDGIMIPHYSMGSFGTSSPYHANTIIFHAGRYLNLKLLWEDPIEPGELPCGDDGVSDTPICKLFTDCLEATDGCSGNDPLMVENYMTYSYCTRMFTQGQRDRVHAALNDPLAGRNNLWTPANLALTGCGTSSIQDHSNGFSPLQLTSLPMPGQWTIQLPEAGYWQVAVFNGAGLQVTQWRTTRQQTLLDLSGQAPGLYVVRATQPDGRSLTGKVARP